jgi:hypothetical protein
MSHVSDGDGHLDHYQRGSIRAPTTSSTATRYSMGAEQEVKVLWGILTEENPHQRQGRRREAGSDGSRR